MGNIVVEELKQVPTSEQRVEIVERKGTGHPDYICDSIVNEISIALSAEYLKRAGAILHHNIDKALLAAGEVRNRFGGGRVLKPMKLVIGDRATYQLEKVDIPVEEISLRSAKKWLSSNLRYVNADEHVVYQVELKQGSASLQDIFKRRKEVIGANDTSAAVGYAPMTPTEKIVLDVERFANSPSFKKRYPMSGEDIKVMGLRTNKHLDLTVSMAFVDRQVPSEAAYFRGKDEIIRDLQQFTSSYTAFDQSQVHLNALDERGRGVDGVYLTVLGTSADGGDSGQVGRGNRVNGLISLNRPASSEAAAGKNPVSHVGKIYNLLSFRMAEKIYEKVSGLQEVYVWLLSEIGRRIDQPKLAAAQMVLGRGTSLAEIKGQVQEAMDSELARIDRFCQDLARGRIPIC